jgi:hypothetical protein
MFVGLVRDPRWEPPEGAPEPERRRSWRIPWRTIVTLIVFCTMLALVPPVGEAFGPLAGYGFLCLAVAIGGWRFDRWLGRQYWRGLKDYQA